MTEIKRDDRGREQIKAWYGLAVTTGREKVIQERLKNLAKNEVWENQIFRVYIPSIKEIGKNGKEKEVLVYTQVVYIEMILNDDTYNAVKIDGVRHIMGDPSPIPEEEIRRQFEMSGIPYDDESNLLQDNTVVIILDETKGAFNGQEGTIKGYDKTAGEYEVEVNVAGSPVSVMVNKNKLKTK
ncbi:hypothetical protein CN918_26875 [Priestia megaterium]|nr:hypothetical protein CN918_26875 [Priestia megaterium]